MADSGKSKSAPTVVAKFNQLWQEQQGLASKAEELELKLNEHSLVIDMLRDVDPTRKCYRMVGGVLVERTIKEVLPALESNKELSLSNLTRCTLPNVGTRTGSRVPRVYDAYSTKKGLCLALLQFSALYILMSHC
uniref:Prefoldin subunit 2 n=1 Tax=Gopherus evgoodei TaxID=1825980 RepID=A0A8C4XY66_9SAUR